MASPSRRVLITGASGFTGRWLGARLTQAGYQVYGLTQEPARTPAEIQADLCDPPALRAALETARPDYIVHLAAITFVPHSDSAEIYGVNLFGTLNLLDAILAVGLQPRKVLIASSANVYGNPPVEVIDETVCPAPVNHYANSKLAMEHMVRTYDDRLPLVITRRRSLSIPKSSPPPAPPGRLDLLAHPGLPALPARQAPPALRVIRAQQALPGLRAPPALRARQVIRAPRARPARM